MWHGKVVLGRNIIYLFLLAKIGKFQKTSKSQGNFFANYNKRCCADRDPSTTLGMTEGRLEMTLVLSSRLSEAHGEIPRLGSGGQCSGRSGGQRGLIDDGRVFGRTKWTYGMTGKHRVGGKRSSFLPTFVFRPLTPPYMRFRIRRFFVYDTGT